MLTVWILNKLSFYTFQRTTNKGAAHIRLKGELIIVHTHSDDGAITLAFVATSFWATPVVVHDGDSCQLVFFFLPFWCSHCHCLCGGVVCLLLSCCCFSGILAVAAVAVVDDVVGILFCPFLTLKAPRKMHLKMSSAVVVCCK